MLKKYFYYVYGVSLLFAYAQNSYAIVSNIITGTVTDLNPPTFSSPAVVAINPGGTIAYVANQVANDLSVVNIATNKVTRVVDDPHGFIQLPTSIAFTPDGNKAYVVNNGNNSVAIVDVQSIIVTATVSDPMHTLQNPLDIAIAPDGTKAYVVNNLGSVSVLTIATNTINSVVADGNFNFPFAVAISPIEADYKAYVLNQGNNTVSIINVATDTVTPAGIVDAGAYPFNFSNNVVFTSDGKKAYVTNFNSNNVNIIDAADNKVVGTVYDPSSYLAAPEGCAIMPNDLSLYVTNNNINKVVVVSVESDAVTQLVSDPLSTLAYPVAIAITPDSSTGYIVNVENNSVSILFIAEPVLPPTAIYGCKIQNNFLTQIDLTNKISWFAPTSGNAPVAYRIYRDAGLTQFVASVPASGVLQYYDHNRNPSVVYSYYIVSVDLNGGVSAPASVTVTNYCG